MNVRTTIVLADPIHEQLRKRARDAGTSMRMLILEALEKAYPEHRQGKPVAGRLGRRKRQARSLGPVK